MAAPTFVGEGTPDAVNGSDTIEPTNPASLLVDDILVAWIVSGDDDKGFSFPAGWTIVDESPDGDPSGGKGAWAWRRVTSAGESSATITITQTSNAAQTFAGIFALRGCKSSGDPYGQSLRIIGDPTKIAEMSAITTTVADSLLICIGLCEDNRSAKDDATDYALQYSGLTTIGSDAGYGVWVQSAASITTYSADSAGQDGFQDENHVNYTIDFLPETAVSYTIIAAAGTFTYTGIATNLVATRIIQPDSQLFTYSGISTNVQYGRVIAPDVGSYSYSGISSTLSASRMLGIDTGNYNLTGIATNLNFGYAFSAISGSFSYSGVSQDLFRAAIINPVSGSYSYTGYEVFFPTQIAIASGSYIYSGVDITLTIVRNDPGYNPKIELKREPHKMEFFNVPDRIAKKFERQPRKFGEDVE